jgi:hypothetical protein
MLFMNHDEITEAVLKAGVYGDANLVRATLILQDLRDLADSVSDGWCYWPKPCRAAKKLQELIQDALPTPSNNYMAKLVPDAALKKALSPIKAFLTREAKNLQGKTLDI